MAAFVPIGITSVSASGNTVTLTLARAPIGSGLYVNYGLFTDIVGNAGATSFTGGWQGGIGRGGALRSSATFTGSVSKIAQYDWATPFRQNVP